jgi:hypothetical protein
VGWVGTHARAPSESVDSPATQTTPPGRRVDNTRAFLISLLLLAVSQPLPAAAADVAVGTPEVRMNGPPGAQGLEAAINAYGAEHLDQAITGIKAAQRAGLTVPQAARAHYYLGLAYRKQGKPGDAITELTRALNEKRGLSAAERADAERNRSAACQEAGISETEAVVVESRVGKGDDAVSSVHRRASAASRAHERLTTGALPSPTVASDWSGGTKVAVARPERLRKLKTIYVTDMVARGSQPYVATPEVTVAPAVTSAEPLQPHWPPPNTVREAGPQPQPQPHVTTPEIAVKAAVAPSPAARALPPAPKTVPEKVPQPQVNAPPPAAVRLQVGEVASRNEAFALIVRLKSFRGELATQKLQIGEAVLDGGGTVYRLYLGPYADTREAKADCKSLRVSGYNCRLE